MSGNSDGGRVKADPRQSITRFFGQVQILPHYQYWAENHEKYTTVCIPIDRLMIPLYQANPYNNTIRKNVRGLAVVGLLLGLLHEFSLDLLSSGNLTEHIPTISKG